MAPKSRWLTGCCGGMSCTQTLLLSFLLLQICFFLYLMRNHKFFQQSVYDMSKLVDSSWQPADLSMFDLERRSHPDPVQTVEYTATYPATLLSRGLERLERHRMHAVENITGRLVDVEFPDLRYRSDAEVRDRLRRMFRELPSAFDPKYKNPCWQDPAKGLSCLPYAYILGQPKSGTSDLFLRIVAHDLIIPPMRKEVRWLTRGEFARSGMNHEEDESADPNPHVTSKMLIGPGSSIFSFTIAFSRLVKVIKASDNPSATQLVTIDGGPHTFWWPTQGPDGAYFPKDIPPPQIIRVMQPNAKFLVIMNDPVKRFYSDYYFLGDDLRPVREDQGKSVDELHQRAVVQVDMFYSCVDKYIAILREQESKANLVIPAFHNEHIKLPSKYRNALPLWIRASQMCASDRMEFARAGWGRLSIGLYVLHLLRWLEHFDPAQFLLLRLEDFEKNRVDFMTRVFAFLGVGEPGDWKRVLNEHHANENRLPRDAILSSTESLLRDFYLPYNQLLVQIVEGLFEPGNSERFLWKYQDASGQPSSLRAKQLLQQREIVSRPPVDVSRDGNDELGRDAEAAHSENERAHVPNKGEIRGKGGDSGGDRTAEEAAGSHDLMDLSMHAMQKGNMRLRGPRLQHQGSHGAEEPLELRPEAFELRELPAPPDVEEEPLFPRQSSDFYRSPSKAAPELCAAAFALDLPHLKFLLHTIGVPPDLQFLADAKRTAFHCLALVYSVGEAHSYSHVFAQLKGVETRMSAHLKPPLPTLLDSVSPRVILQHLSEDVNATAQWLLRAGVPFNTTDSGGNTPLILAAYGGLTGLVEVLVEEYKRADLSLDAVDQMYHRTAMHYAAFQGHVKVCAILHQAGASLHIKDSLGVTVYDVVSNPGPISAEDVLAYLGITQRPAKQIPRVLHPEDFPDNHTVGWRHGSGGWSTARLAGREQDLDCSSVDQYFAHEITAEEIFHKYLTRNAPILIKGLIDDWGVTTRYQMQTLREERGSLGVAVSDIPYAKKFGGERAVDMTLGDYIDGMMNQSLPGGDHPWYVFKGHPIPMESDDSPNSLVPYAQCPTPLVLQKAFGMGKGYGWGPSTGQLPETDGRAANDSQPVFRDKSERKLFVNAQWALGGAGTGAPEHFHNTAWNAVVYGAKMWVFHPPQDAVMSNEQILEFVETSEFMKTARTCTQLAGEVMIIPENYGHGVLNLQHTIAIATEYKYSLFRIRPQTRAFTLTPMFNNRQGTISRGSNRRAQH